ncbi:uncharacterized protein CC84DRAFT_222705 [Paraphaeosphaeria sporulosa]|uniref:WSC domain-containing protein n=1 Tax=Paraphaeosphaeria sporulosa TaxID=1460663 RepID=A0A177C533_9PLEO|nr:uncharacterized protein CC84DRAFT_222705 [Paraphaeosphaeria sporulosa]OAG01827.1 hypothetical protein CC84DRAFT_222705 [Paraphaeosphaeria sporulosa]
MVNDSECGMSCTGNVGETCGGPVRINVYQGPTDLPITSRGDDITFKYIGCYPDAVESRLLPAEPLAGLTLTVGTCIDACRSAGFSSNERSTAYAGVEYSQGEWLLPVLPTYFQLLSASEPLFSHRHSLHLVLWQARSATTFESVLSHPSRINKCAHS